MVVRYDLVSIVRGLVFIFVGFVLSAECYLGGREISYIIGYIVTLSKMLSYAALTVRKQLRSTPMPGLD